MTLRRLTDDPSKAGYGSMLRKARQESLPVEAERRIAAAVLAPSATISEAPASTGPSLLIKGALGLCAIAVVAASVFSTRSSEPSPAAPAPPPSASPSPSIEHVAGPAAEPDATEGVEAASLSVHDLPAVADRPTAPRAASTDDDDNLGAEAASLRAVREDITSGRGGDALRKLDRYDVRFGAKGAMREEAQVQRVEALLQVGKTREANELAARLLAAHPTGPFARKLRSLMSTMAPHGTAAAPSGDPDPNR